MTPRVALAAGLVVLGLATGLASVAIHDASWGWFVVAVAAPAVTATAAPSGQPRLGFTLGWLVVPAFALLGRPEGDYVVSANARGYGLLVAALVLLGAAVATLPRPSGLPT